MSWLSCIRSIEQDRSPPISNCVIGSNPTSATLAFASARFLPTKSGILRSPLRVDTVPKRSSLEHPYTRRGIKHRTAGRLCIIFVLGVIDAPHHCVFRIVSDLIAPVLFGLSPETCCLG